MSIRNVAAMVPAGRFLELSVPTTDIQASLEFYLRLGFTEITTNDIRPYFYTAISDGRIVIGLHAENLEAPALTFVQPEIAQRAQEIVAAGIEPVFAKLGIDAFHEVGLEGPDNHLVVMIEARTFSQTYLDELPPPIIGHCEAFKLRSRDLERSTVFWEAAGFVLDREDESTRTLITRGLAITLDEHQRSVEPVLHFQSANIDQSLAAIDAANISARPASEGHVIVSPEGTRIVVA